MLKRSIGLVLSLCFLVLTFCAGSALSAYADQGEAVVNTLSVTLKDGSNAESASDIVLYSDQVLKLYVKGENYSDKVLTIIAGTWSYPNWSNQLKKGKEYTLSKGVITLDGKKVYKKIGEGMLTMQINLPGGQRRWVKMNVENPPFKALPTSITKVKAGKKSLTVKWKKLKKIKKYELQISTDKKFKKGVLSKSVKKAGTTSCKFKKLKSRKKYYVRIRAIYIDPDGQELPSDWSKAKSVKVK